MNKTVIILSLKLHEKCSYSEFSGSVFYRIWTEYEVILRISPYSVQMRENADHKNSEYGHFSRNVKLLFDLILKLK